MTVWSLLCDGWFWEMTWLSLFYDWGSPGEMTVWPLLYDG